MVFTSKEESTMNLNKKRCKPCEGGIPALSRNEVAELRKYIDDNWIVINDVKISREFAFVSYRHTMDFVNKVADLAEEEGHHPVMHVYYGKVEIELWTHAINGLSENDFIMAAKIDEL
jgi:4a-hydroxytetrahydrobiopterin dehydratase